MPEYLAPGVYIEEIATGPRPIEGVSTSTAGFVGGAERGPEYPLFITSWLQYQRWYGGYIDDSYMPFAVQGFFMNGGQRCYVTRVVPTGGTLIPPPAPAPAPGPGPAPAPGPAAPIVPSPATLAQDGITYTAIGKGAWGNHVQVKVDLSTKKPIGAPGVPAAETWFKLTVLYYKEPLNPPGDPIANPKLRQPDALEVFDNLTLKAGETNNVLTVLNSSSHLVQLSWTGGPGIPPAATPPVKPLASLTGGTNGSALQAADLQGKGPDITKDPKTDPVGNLGFGLDSLAFNDDISLVTVPDEVRVPAITAAVINQCELHRDRFAIVTSQQTDSPANLKAHPDSQYAALYFPWIQIFDPTIDDSRLIPASGHVTGLIARTDIERGVHKAPANEVLRGAIDLQVPVTKGMQDDLNPHGVNCIRDFRPHGRGIRLYGARTMSSDSQWKYINVRRLFIFLEKSIDHGTQWVVFEPNAPELWGAVVRSISNFLTTVWRNGALFGTTREEAFFVKCDRTTMTEDDLDNGRLICYIGVAPVKPAEFVIFRFSQKTLDAPA